MNQKNDAIKEEDMVLIDTWWNVNILTPQSFGEEQLVLIDTWWNVNKTLDDIYEVLYLF